MLEILIPHEMLKSQNYFDTLKSSENYGLTIPELIVNNIHSLFKDLSNDLKWIGNIFGNPERLVLGTRFELSDLSGEFKALYKPFQEAYLDVKAFVERIQEKVLSPLMMGKTERNVFRAITDYMCGIGCLFPKNRD